MFPRMQFAGRILPGAFFGRRTPRRHSGMQLRASPSRRKCRQSALVGTQLHSASLVRGPKPCNQSLPFTRAHAVRASSCMHQKLRELTCMSLSLSEGLSTHEAEVRLKYTSTVHKYAEPYVATYCAMRIFYSLRLKILSFYQSQSGHACIFC